MCLTDMQGTFVAILDNMSGRATNKAMKQELGWEEGQYLQVRSELVKAGVIQLGRCRGGMVMFKEPDEQSDYPAMGAASTVADPFPKF